MSGHAPIEHTGIASIRGPVLVVEQVDGVGWDEAAEIRLASGEVRHGVVLDISRDLAVVEVYEGTAGLRLDELRVSFTGSPLSIPVGEGWLGRVVDGRGEPLDGGPPIFAATTRTVQGHPINPAARATPVEPILTGVSVIDGLATLVRGQKLPVFSVGGLPHLELAAQVAAQATAGGEPFAVVFAAMGITNADAAMVRDTLEQRAAAGDLALFLNTADDPLVERILTPRLALTVAEHLAFELDRHVLVVMADMTSYCEAVREVSAARGEIPSRAGRIKGRVGSITQLPVLTMPAGDITHPVPDLTGYITEGQLVLSHDAHVRGIYPPFDPLRSLSRLMRLGAGQGQTREDHLELAAQLYALVAEAQHAADLAEVIGADALSESQRTYLAFRDAFESDLVTQGRSESRPLAETLERGWKVASMLPRRELSMISERTLDERYEGVLDAAARPTG
jgi:V/A-type H+-transporting ATPase subunit B